MKYLNIQNKMEKKTLENERKKEEKIKIFSIYNIYNMYMRG